MFPAEYEAFLMDDEPEYDVFQFDDLCSASECVISSASLELKPFPDSLKYSFSRPNESLSVIIAFDLDQG